MEFFKRLLFVILFCFSSFVLQAQNLDILIAEGKKFLGEKEYEQAEQTYYKALLIAEQENELEKQGQIYNNLGIVYKRKAEYQKSIETYAKSLAIYHESGNAKATAEAQLNLGNALNKMGLYDVSMPYLFKALEISSRLENKPLEANVCSVLGTVNYNLGQFESAEDYHWRSLQIYSDLDDEKSISKVNHNLAELFIEIGELEKAIECLNSEKKIKLKSDKSLASNTILFGELYLKYENWDSALYCFNTILKERIESGNNSLLASSYYHLANYYDAIKRTDLADSYLDSAYFWSDSLIQNRMSIEILERQLQIELMKMGNVEFAEKHNKWTGLKDSVTGDQTQMLTLTLSNDYKILKKDKEIKVSQTNIKLKDAENKNLNFKYELALIGLMIFLVLVLVIFFLSMRMRKKNDKLRLQNETIQNLHSELNHRTKNYYQMFGGMLYDDLEDEENESVREVLRHYLSRVNAMSQIQHHLVYTESETQQKIQLNIYLGQLIDEIDLALNNKEFSVSIQRKMAEVTIDYHKALHIGIVLNELFQNAFKHGFQAISNPKIKVDLFSKADFYFLIIEDNGIGIDPKSVIKKRSKGMDLISDLMFKIGGELNHESGENKGVKIELIFPK